MDRTGGEKGRKRGRGREEEEEVEERRVDLSKAHPKLKTAEAC